MRSLLRTSADVALIFLATVCALLIRDDFATTASRIYSLAPYVFGTFIASLIVLPISGLSQTIWRFSSPHDHLRILAAVASIVGISLLAGFAANRLELVPRSLPAIQFLMCYLTMAGTRDLFRSVHWFRKTRASNPKQFGELSSTEPTTIVVVGVTQLLEIYLRLVDFIGRDKIRVVALLDNGGRHKGRVIREHTIVGGAENIQEVLEDLQTHGVCVDRIVVLSEISSLSSHAQDGLSRIAAEGKILVERLTAEMLITERPVPTHSFRRTITTNEPHSMTAGSTFNVPAERIIELSRRSYWPLKRLMDVALASLLIVVLAPSFIFAAILTAFSVGRPLLFWQQRPGLAGRPLRVVKFRTMDRSTSMHGAKLTDEERVTPIGNFMRRSRLDELPQLFSILAGSMSFVGPRPLLPHDQLGSADARLLVRPGLTGLAQVSGGRAISAEDKMALDLWYIRNANLWLDVKIMFKTAALLLGQERIDDRVIAEAWRELALLNMVESSLVSAAE